MDCSEADFGTSVRVSKWPGSRLQELGGHENQQVACQQKAGDPRGGELVPSAA